MKRAALLLGAVCGLLVAWLVGCARTPCEDNGGCLDVEACVEGRCEPVDCLTNAHCDIEHTCNLGTYACDPGCDGDDDCLAENYCRTATSTCEPRQCFDTQLDCAPGELCDRDSGQCALDSKPHCEPCNGDGPCGADGHCIDLGGGDGSFCFIDCNPDDLSSCPSAYQCSPTEFGNSCLAYCPYLD